MLRRLGKGATRKLHDGSTGRFKPIAKDHRLLEIEVEFGNATRLGA